MTGHRSDARRNYQRILAVAEAEVAAHGAQASQEQIARIAGVGSATVRRHFPTRRTLLEAVFQERIEGLCERAQRLSAAEDGRTALLEWLHALVLYAVSARGFAHTLSYEPPTEKPSPNSCGSRIEAAATPLLQRAIRDKAVAPHVTFHDLLTLSVGIALATEHHTDPDTQADRLFRLAVEGLSPEQVTAGVPVASGSSAPVTESLPNERV
ncbi:MULTISPECIES: TetR/AcrR family transcriptional regulator [unclassified Streptomyces]|uniref:TetR/AcrR family transcriptional regulator n=1 Tax=unclassified Streptomyces TaxID=2593676 RepID=UPI0006AFCB7D|nr:MULTISPECIES: TetR/AcrR family transcriptional regulator [unclassified Streptomyces]KOX25119.1 TetR family transcriptional regulator [Streptomyces sp. NRRL F-6491]KOX37778.1 TetR family transcriptional regulator [Streptomyces sp. NRRL F-6492]